MVPELKNPDHLHRGGAVPENYLAERFHHVYGDHKTALRRIPYGSYLSGPAHRTLIGDWSFSSEGSPDESFDVVTVVSSRRLEAMRIENYYDGMGLSHGNGRIGYRFRESTFRMISEIPFQPQPSPQRYYYLEIIDGR
jgi:hypothetical protein